MNERPEVAHEYPRVARARYGWGGPAHPELEALLHGERRRFHSVLADTLRYREDLARIPVRAPDTERSPRWDNPWFFGLDGAVLYALLRTRQPRVIVEVGSGQSTRFARRAITDGALSTRLVSIDPAPRADVDALCDSVVRAPLEEAATDPQLLNLAPGDVLFVDSSHQAFMNSDVTVLWLEVMPRLAPGVLVHLHDIFIPWDYRPDWAGRAYNEQYLLASALLLSRRFEVVLPAFYCHVDAELRAVLTPLWRDLGLLGYYEDSSGVPEYAVAGHSFWVRVTGG